MSQAVLPPIPRPPHDPTSLLLNQRLGWSVLESETVTVGSTVKLARFPGSLRWMTEPSGSFGGLRPPANVAIADAGDVWLLDPVSGRLKRFDPCRCVFETVPCLNPVVGAGGIVLCGADLYISDPAGGVVNVLALPDLVIRKSLKAPAAWQPEGIVIGRRGTAYIADPMNGAIHRFSRFGDYLGAWLGFGDSRHLAIAQDGTIYAAGDLAAYRVGADGSAIPLDQPADDLVSEFALLPFKVDPNGNMWLGVWCLPRSNVAFDLSGNPITPGPQAAVQIYEKLGTMIVGPLDSLIDGCTWHRAILRGKVAEGSRVGIDTLTSDLPLPQSQIDVQPDFAWETRLQCLGMDGDWDGLIRSVKGRYIWIRFTLSGNGASTPTLDNIEVEFPRISLRRFMPAVYGFEPASADFTDRLMGLPDRVLREFEHELDYQAADYDPLSTPFLDWLASWIGVPQDRQVPEALRRRMLKEAGKGQAMTGTVHDLWRQLVLMFGFDQVRTTCQCDATPCSCNKPAETCPPTPKHVWQWTPPPLILEHYKLRRWMELGYGRLGDQAMLWGRSIVNRSQLGENARVGVTQLKASQDPLRDPFYVYAHKFTVFAPVCAGSTPERKRALENLIARTTPAHTMATIRYVEPRFRIGVQSMIALDSVVGRLPSCGVRLGSTPIGPASVLTGDSQTRLGSTRLGPPADMN
jgi:phage tail-like protein